MNFSSNRTYAKPIRTYAKPICHSERSEESREILRFTQNDRHNSCVIPLKIGQDLRKAYMSF